MSAQPYMAEGDAREAILARIRAALPGEPASVAQSHAGIVRSYQRNGELDHAACIDLFVDRLLDYDARVISAGSEAMIAGAVAEALAECGETRLIISASLDSAWIPAGLDITIDEASATDVVDAAQAVITTCEVAIASTGTIILVHAGAQGRRILTLLPDHHICIVRRDQVCELVPEALSRLSAYDGLPITTISGPSATSDIEMTRIRGVHGPRRLTVILCG